jgi:hypothetical protein
MSLLCILFLSLKMGVTNKKIRELYAHIRFNLAKITVLVAFHCSNIYMFCTKEKSLIQLNTLVSVIIGAGIK